jgi:hypothetical protein
MTLSILNVLTQFNNMTFSILALDTVVLSVIMQNIVMLRVIVLTVVMLRVIVLNVVMLSLIMLNVVMLIVMEPLLHVGFQAFQAYMGVREWQAPVPPVLPIKIKSVLLVG